MAPTWPSTRAKSTGPRPRQAGISFAFLKATEGGDRVDDQFARNWRETQAAGLPRGAYHFFYFCRPAIEQARWFIEHVPKEPGALPPVLDIEWNHRSPIVHRPAGTRLSALGDAHLPACARPATTASGRSSTLRLISSWTTISAGITGYSWWLRSVAGHPDDKYDSQPFLFWQYTGTGIVPGIDGNADINVFNGSAKDWRDWLRAHAA